MRHFVRLPLVLGFLTLSLFAQDKGAWRAASKTARSITGDVAFGGEKFAINFLSYPLAQIRVVTPAELKATFDLAELPAGSGNLYRLDIPGATKFVHKNTLCGAEDTQWMVTYASGKDLQIAFFSGESIPVLTPEAVASGTNLCGTYSYVR
jgi:hypothetical protein